MVTATEETDPVEAAKVALLKHLDFLKQKVAQVLVHLPIRFGIFMDSFYTAFFLCESHELVADTSRDHTRKPRLSGHCSR